MVNGKGPFTPTGTEGDPIARVHSNDQQPKSVRAKNLLAILRTRHEQFIDAITDAVFLAVNQVQDKRIEFAEHKTPSAEDIFFDVAFELLPFGILLNKSVRIFTRENYESFLRTRLAFSLMGKDARGNRSSASFATALHQAGKKEVNQFFLRTVDLRTIYNANVFEFFETIDENVRKALNKYHDASRVLSKIEQRSQKLDPTDSPSTAIGNPALSTARQLKYTQNSLIDYYRLLLEEVKTDQELDTIIKFLNEQISGTAHDYQQLQRAYTLWFELCIWIEIYNPKNIKPGSIEVKMEIINSRIVIFAKNASNGKRVTTIVPPKIVEYLIIRIVNSPYFMVKGNGLPALQRVWLQVSQDMSTSKRNLIGKIVR